MLRKCIKALLVSTRCAIIGIAIGLCIQVLLCDVWQLPWAICR